jgi:hypothetical protein
VSPRENQRDRSSFTKGGGGNPAPKESERAAFGPSSLLARRDSGHGATGALSLITEVEGRLASQEISRCRIINATRDAADVRY